MKPKPIFMHFKCYPSLLACSHLRCLDGIQVLLLHLLPCYRQLFLNLENKILSPGLQLFVTYFTFKKLQLLVILDIAVDHIMISIILRSLVQPWSGMCYGTHVPCDPQKNCSIELPAGHCIGKNRSGCKCQFIHFDYCLPVVGMPSGINIRDSLGYHYKSKSITQNWTREAYYEARLKGQFSVS